MAVLKEPKERIVSNPMKRLLVLSMLLVMLLPIMAFASEGYGAGAVKEGETYDVEQILIYALQDEYLARAEYTAITENFKVGRPFANIMRAEGVHIDLLLPLFAAYGVPVPADTAASLVTLPDSLESAYQLGVKAEEANIMMYDTFLKQKNLPLDVAHVLETLKWSSGNHLNAFSQGLGRNTTGRAGGGGCGCWDGSLDSEENDPNNNWSSSSSSTFE